MDDIKNIFSNKQIKKKAPTYEWQDFSLQIIKELNIPNFKRNSIFKACKENPKSTIERALNDTKELCNNGEAWKYFFKILNKF